MADNRISEARQPADMDHKHDDPLAELARIVGFEDEGNNTADDDADTVQADAGFDLEAELMRELEIDVSGNDDQAATDAGHSELEPSSEQLQQDIQQTASKTANEQIVSLHADTPAGPKPAAGEVNESWPHAAPSIAEQMTSLEAELQAAFSALEGKSNEPAPQAEIKPEPEFQAVSDPQPEEQQQPEPAAVEQTVRMPEASAAPIESIAESDELKEAYDRLQKDIDATKPQEDAAGNEDGDLTEMLLAEMAEVEAEAAEAMPQPEAIAQPSEMPFDPSGIAESDSVPETMAALDVPEIEQETAAPAQPKDNDFGLPLEDELDVLTAPEPAAEQIEASAHAEVNDYAEAGGSDPVLTATELDATPVTYPDASTDSRLPVEQIDDRSGGKSYQDEYTDGTFLGDDDFRPEDIAAPSFDEFEGDDGERSGRRGLVAAAVVLGIAVVGGGGFYLWNSSLGGNAASDGPRIIAANNDPVKVKPENPGGKTVPNQDLAVYDKVAGNDTSANQDQNLVTTTEEPIDVVQRTLDPDTLPLEGRAAAVESAAKSEDRLAATSTLDPDPAAETGTNGVAPRKVRTLVVRPDGTIVARETPAATAPASLTSSNPASAPNTATAPNRATAGVAATVGTASSTNAAPTPVEVAAVTPTVPVPSTESATSSNSSATAQNAALPPIDDNLRDTGALPLPEARPSTAAQGNAAQAPTVVASADTGASDLRAAIAAPVPSTRPAEQPVNIVEAVTERGNLAGSNTTSNPGGYMVQISSQPSEAAAQESYQNLSRRYASIIGDKGVDFQRADIPNRGVFYRVRIPAGSKDEANALCASYKAAGGSCFVAR